MVQFELEKQNPDVDGPPIRYPNPAIVPTICSPILGEDGKEMAVDDATAWGQLCEGDPDKLRELYLAMQPFPHIVFDNLFDATQLEDAIEYWPDETWDEWKRFQGGKRSSVKRRIPEGLLEILDGFNMEATRKWLSRLTGIPDLISDAQFAGAGMHEVPPKGWLGIHVDFNRNLKMYRRLNAILYLNPAWEDGYGGALELRRGPDSKRKSDRAMVMPVWNRLVVMESSERSWHGHPTPLSCPDGMTRRSLAWYFYTSTPGPGYAADHSTIYAGRKET